MLRGMWSTKIIHSATPRSRSILRSCPSEAAAITDRTPPAGGGSAELSLEFEWTSDIEHTARDHLQANTAGRKKVSLISHPAIFLD